MSTHHVRNPPMTPANLERAKADIKKYSIDHEPIRWAEGHMLVSQQYLIEVLKSSGSTRAADKGIEHIEEALKVITEEHPFFARAQFELAHMYPRRVASNRTENLTKAHACAKTALRACKKNPLYPRSFVAETYARIGSIHAENDFKSSDSRAVNQDLAIRHYLACLELSSMDDTYNEQWAERQLQVAVIYVNRKNGKLRSNMKVAIKHLLEALKVFTKPKHRDDWAKTHECLALSYGQLHNTAKEAAHLAKMSQEAFTEEMSTLAEKCIASCTNALQVFSTTYYPVRW
jgi:tetratricopeptide (TPR) repeat protein